MSRIVIGLACLVSLSPAVASAQSRPSTTAMSCAQAQAIVASRGAVVLGTGGQTYDRFVRDRGFCGPTQATRTTFVPAGDTPQCFIGYRCIDPSGDFLGD